MKTEIVAESFESLADSWVGPGGLNWSSVFVLPTWWRVWWQHFGHGELFLATVQQAGEIVGVIPLRIAGGEADFIGSEDVCDYLDFVIAPGKEAVFFTTLLDELTGRGITGLNLNHLRPDSTVMTHLLDIARGRGYEVTCSENGVSLELDLPSTWEDYLAVLDKKQRHEVRRKLRRLWESGNVNYYCLKASPEQVSDYMDRFLELFALSGVEKAGFMTAEMEAFFRSLALATAEIGLLRFGIVEINNEMTAMILGFDYNSTMYLYNSAYDPEHNALSVGLLCKVLCLKESIHQQRKKWDFLQGGESYKYRIGGQEVPLHSCRIKLG